MKKSYFYVLLVLAAIALLYIVITDGFSSLVMFGLGYLTCLVMVKNYMRAKEYLAIIFGKIKGLFGKKNAEVPVEVIEEVIEKEAEIVDELPKKKKKKKKKA